MTVPSREEAARLLQSLEPPAWHVRHARAVAEIASWLARRVEQRATGGNASADQLRRSGRRQLPLDRRLVEAAALLHDVDKALDHQAGRRRARDAGVDLPHGEAGATWLAARGHPELAEAVALHPVTLLVDPESARRVLRASLEARLVAYADKRAGPRVVPVATRFAHWRRRYPRGDPGDGWSEAAAERAWEAARALERGVCARAGCAPEDVARVRWTARAFEAASR